MRIFIDKYNIVLYLTNLKNMEIAVETFFFFFF